MSVCSDIGEFLDMLKEMRIVDDKIVQELNTTIPTASFSSKVDAAATCRDLFTKLVESYNNREKALHQCLGMAAENLQKLKEQKAASPNDIQVIKQLRNEQMKLRELQTQIGVEEIIRGRSLKIYNERCRGFYKPEESSLPS